MVIANHAFDDYTSMLHSVLIKTIRVRQLFKVLLNKPTFFYKPKVPIAWISTKHDLNETCMNLRKTTRNTLTKQQ